MQNTVKYKSKKMGDKFHFKGKPNQISTFLQEYQKYFQTEDVKFTIKVLFNENVQTEQHEKILFNSLFQDNDIGRKEDFPTPKYDFYNLTIGKFE